ncbi:hypothetical protein [Oceanidesulfovibrio marinus]|uniref:hypothetical protein n=1 Tax=Oceanidesulfovibrio marinus TaxID=370038 RepID=UPI00142F0109|nr:hypothetical protein [Oceanidesulfovibrio marinus]
MTRTLCLTRCLLFIALLLAPCGVRAQDSPAPSSSSSFSGGKPVGGAKAGIALAAPDKATTTPSPLAVYEHARAVPEVKADRAVAPFASDATASADEYQSIVPFESELFQEPNPYQVDTSLEELLSPKSLAALPPDLVREPGAAIEGWPYSIDTAPFDEEAVDDLATRVAAAKEARRIARERKAMQERERKAAEAKRLAEQKRKEEEAKRLAEEKRKEEEAAAQRIAEQQRKAEELKKKAEAQRLEALRRKELAEAKPQAQPKPVEKAPEVVKKPVTKQPEVAQKPAPAEQKQVAMAPQPKPATKKPSAAYARPGGRLETDPTVLANPKAAKALEQFKHFALEWLAKNNRSYVKGTREHVKVTQEGNLYVAQYMQSEPSSLETLVKPSEYEHTPFIGVMRYEEKLFRSEGSTAEAAKSGTFQEVDSTRITEIFRYAKNKWQY